VPTIGFDAMTTLKRSDFGLGKYIPQVGDAIQMHLTIQGAEAKPYADYLKAEAAKH
jgi:polyisoprenoid-binding protein YceI